MSDMLYFILCGLLTAGILIGISRLSKPRTAVLGNLLSAMCIAGAVVLTMVRYELLPLPMLWISMGIGLVCGLYGAYRVKMIAMPQAVALLNGFGGASSALVAAVAVTEGGPLDMFSAIMAGLALAVGGATFTGSMVAACKLHGVMSQKPAALKGHSGLIALTLAITAAATAAMAVVPSGQGFWMAMCALGSGCFGVLFTLRVGGADMPITISLLNSLSGVAGAVAGMALGDILLVAVGGVVGASGLLLTQIMCRAMNRSLKDILTGRTVAPVSGQADVSADEPQTDTLREASPREEADPARILKDAKRVMIVPGYGMALAQAQHLVRALMDRLEQNGAEVSFAIHPVAGRMPGHMNILLAEADIPYEKLLELDDANPMFPECDAAVIIGANDVVNPAAATAEDTPIYGMPILHAQAAKQILVLNYDLKPGYAGVENPLYRQPNTIVLTGDAKETLQTLLGAVSVLS